MVKSWWDRSLLAKLLEVSYDILLPYAMRRVTWSKWECCVRSIPLIAHCSLWLYLRSSSRISRVIHHGVDAPTQKVNAYIALFHETVASSSVCKLLIPLVDWTLQIIHRLLLPQLIDCCHVSLLHLVLIRSDLWTRELVISFKLITLRCIISILGFHRDSVIFGQLTCHLFVLYNMNYRPLPLWPCLIFP